MCIHEEVVFSLEGLGRWCTGLASNYNVSYFSVSDCVTIFSRSSRCGNNTGNCTKAAAFPSGRSEEISTMSQIVLSVITVCVCNHGSDEHVK